MRKVLCYIMAAVLLVTTLSNHASANHSEQTDRTNCYEVFQVDNGTYYSYVLYKDGIEWNVKLFVGTDGTCRISSRQSDSSDIYIKELEIPAIRSYDANRIEKLALQHCGDTKDSVVSSVSNSLWEAADCETAPTRDSVWADLKPQLVAREGNEFWDICVHQYTHYAGVNTVDIWWSMSQHYVRIGTANISIGTVLEEAAHIVEYFTGTNVLLYILSQILFIANNVVTSPARVDCYQVDAVYVLEGTVNGGGYTYCQAQKIRRYTGLNELNNTTRAYIADVGISIYVPSNEPELYNHYYRLADKTYQFWSGQ